jgi:hypothetical protein
MGRAREERSACRILEGNSEGKSCFEDLSIDDGMLLK